MSNTAKELNIQSSGKQSPTCTIDSQMPEYSSFIQNLLDKGDVMAEWEKFIEETAYFALKQSSFNTIEQYDNLGRRMVQRYECVSFFSKDKARPWAHFTSTLSQKIRHIRWKWNKKRQRSEGETNSVESSSARKKKAPRQFYEIPVDEEPSSMTEVEAMDAMHKELQKPGKEQDKALLIKTLRVTFKGRRKFIQTTERKSLIKSVVQKYPLLKMANFIQKEFYILKPGMNSDLLKENWTDMLRKLDGMFGDSENEDDSSMDEEKILKTLHKVADVIKYKASKKDVPLISDVQATQAVFNSRKSNSTPCMMVLRNENNAVNSIYVSGDGVDIELGKDIKMAFEILIMIYYNFDLSYPKCHQLLGFLQIALFKDEAPFHRGANFIKFEKRYQNFRPVV